MKKNLILLVFAFSLQCCGQEKETTYWEIEKIYREDKKPFIGLTGYYMQEIFDNNFPRSRANPFAWHVKNKIIKNKICKRKFYY